jgi:hypothetical protein
MFYIIERQDQLDKLGSFKDCFIEFIQFNDAYHPKLNQLSLIYIRDLSSHKGYILCLDHSESFSLDKNTVFDWIKNNTKKLFVLDKKQAMYHYPIADKLYDINFFKPISNTSNNCIDFYYKKYSNLPDINRLIPISKHYEKCENNFNTVLPVISKCSTEDGIYAFNNGPLTRVFYEIESQGIKVDKKCFIEHYKENLIHPEYSLKKGIIYSHYNLYTTTGRPSNTFNGINFAALNKTSGERLCYKPANDKFVEMDIQGYHPRLIGELINFDFKNKNTYETLGELLNVSQEEAKELTFKQLYGGIWKEYKNKPFFKDVDTFIDGMWDTYQYGGTYTTKNKIFISGDTEITQPKLLNYIIQSMETSTNVEMLVNILDYLKDKQTKLVLYTYDAFLFDYSNEDGKEILLTIKDMIKYPINIKQGKTYQGLNKI